jgi:hypothetical protein
MRQYMSGYHLIPKISLFQKKKKKNELDSDIEMAKGPAPTNEISGAAEKATMRIRGRPDTAKAGKG